MNAIILAGGKGSRMKEISDTPKVLLQVQGKPILEHAISNLIDYGAKIIYISVGEKPGEIDNWIEVNSNHFRLEKVNDQPGTLGNSFGVLKSMNMSSQITLLAYGDTIFDLPIKNMLSSHIQNQNDITVLVRDTDHPVDSDLAWIDKGVVKFSKYPHSFNDFSGKLGVSAFYILSPQTFDTSLSRKYSEWFKLIMYFNDSGKKIGLYKLDNGYINDLGTSLRYKNFLKGNINDHI